MLNKCYLSFTNTFNILYRLIDAALMGIFSMLASHFKIKIMVKCRAQSTVGGKGIYRGTFKYNTISHSRFRVIPKIYYITGRANPISCAVGLR